MEQLSAREKARQAALSRSKATKQGPGKAEAHQGHADLPILHRSCGRPSHFRQGKERREPRRQRSQARNVISEEQTNKSHKVLVTAGGQVEGVPTRPEGS